MINDWELVNFVNRKRPIGCVLDWRKILGDGGMFGFFREKSFNIFENLFVLTGLIIL